MVYEKLQNLLGTICDFNILASFLSGETLICFLSKHAWLTQLNSVSNIECDVYRISNLSNQKLFCRHICLGNCNICGMYKLKAHPPFYSLYKRFYAFFRYCNLPENWPIIKKSDHLSSSENLIVTKK